MDVYILMLLISGSGGGEWSASQPGRFTPWQRISGTLEPTWTTGRGDKSCPHQDSNSETFALQPLASRYTERVIQASGFVFGI
jgi:hypothetical protein